jgi:hypothetical protein
MKRIILLMAFLLIITAQLIIAQQVFVSIRFTSNGGETYTWQTTEILVHPKENSVTFTQDSDVRIYFIKYIGEKQTVNTTTAIIESYPFYCEDKSRRSDSVKEYMIGLLKELKAMIKQDMKNMWDKLV